MTVRSRSRRKKEPKEILLIEDDAELRKAIRDTLAPLGWSIIEADGGTQLNKILEFRTWKWVPYAVIADLVLPGVGSSGYDLIRRLSDRYKGKKVPILTISWMTTGEDVLEAQLAGAHGFVRKPFAPDIIVDAIATVRANFDKSEEERERSIIVLNK